jgi:polar amino acid transport system substrate-binding protein
MRKKGKILLTGFLIVMMIGFCFVLTSCKNGDSEESSKLTLTDLAKLSTLESIIQKGELRVGFNSGYMPFEMTDKKGNFIGFDIDIAKELAKAMGVKLNLINTEWDGIIPALITDKFDIIMSGMTITQERNLKVNFADPVIVVGQTILINKKYKNIIKSYKDLNNKKYIVTSKLGTTGEEGVKRHIPKCNYKSFDTETDALMEVLNGKAAAFVYDLPQCAVSYAQQGQGTLIFLNEPFTFEPLAWAIKKGDPDFLNFLNNFLRQIKNDGRYDRIYNKWIKSNKWFDQMK